MDISRLDYVWISFFNNILVQVFSSSFGSFYWFLTIFAKLSILDIW